MAPEIRRPFFVTVKVSSHPTPPLRCGRNGEHSGEGRRLRVDFQLTEVVGPLRAVDAIPEETILWTPSLPCSPEE